MTKRFRAPDLPDDEPDPPRTEPSGSRRPPIRRPPTAVATRRPRDPRDFGPSYYGRRMRMMERMPRLVLAAVLWIASVAGGATGMPLALLLASTLCAALCTWSALAAEGALRSLRRRGRWLRVRRLRSRRRITPREERRLPAT